MARDVPVRIGEWEGKLDVMVVELDDYDVILGNSFFVEASVTIMPCLGGCLIGDPKQPSFVRGIKRDGGSKGKKTECGTALPVAVKD
jgi:hypothetical protein